MEGTRSVSALLIFPYHKKEVYPRYSGEAQWTRLLRGILAILTVLAILIYSLFNIIIEPIQETRSAPSKVFTLPDPIDPVNLNINVVYDVIVVRCIHISLYIADHIMIEETLERLASRKWYD